MTAVVAEKKMPNAPDGAGHDGAVNDDLQGLLAAWRQLGLA